MAPGVEERLSYGTLGGSFSVFPWGAPLCIKRQPTAHWELQPRQADGARRDPSIRMPPLLEYRRGAMGCAKVSFGGNHYEQAYS